MKGVEIIGMRKAFGAFVALHDIDLTVPDGELVALLGPSGCGKSTMLQLLAGFDVPTSGRIMVDGSVLSSEEGIVPPERRGVSMVFQNYAVWPHKTVAENVAFGLKLKRLPRDEVARKLREALAVVKLDQLGDRYPSELSGGQQQRVALARALAVEPKILLLDEPLSNLDANLREEMRFEIKQIHDRLGLTSVYVTHDQSEALVTADKVVVMHEGRIQQIGRPEEIFENPQNSFVATFIGANNELRGALLPDGRVQVGPFAIAAARRHDGVGPSQGGEVALCIRPSKVVLNQPGGAGGQANTFAGVVERASYLGEYRDVLVRLDGGSTIRAFAPPQLDLAPAQKIDVSLPIQNCQIVPVLAGTHIRGKQQE